MLLVISLQLKLLRFPSTPRNKNELQPRYDDASFDGDAPTKLLTLIVNGFYVYLGIVEVTTENVQSLLQGASMLNLLALRNVCCQFLQQHLDASNCLGKSIENIKAAEFVYI